MGAQQFETSITVDKKTSDEDAFTQALKRAQYEYGHGGYTGTMAEKSSFVMIHRAASQKNAQLLMLAYSGSSCAQAVLRQEEIDRVDDKWGPAGAIRYPIDAKTDGVLFFGWASS